MSCMALTLPQSAAPAKPTPRGEQARAVYPQGAGERRRRAPNPSSRRRRSPRVTDSPSPLRIGAPKVIESPIRNPQKIPEEPLFETIFVPQKHKKTGRPKLPKGEA